jgi:hypothetical protein
MLSYYDIFICCLKQDINGATHTFWKGVKSREEVLARQKASRAGPVNTTGFPAFLVELLLEIASYFPTVEIPKFSRTLHNVKYLDRAKTLRALSQMCRLLRSTFSPTYGKDLRSARVLP